MYLSGERDAWDQDPHATFNKGEGKPIKADFSPAPTIHTTYFDEK